MFPDRKATETRTRREGLRGDVTCCLGGIRWMVFLAVLAVGQVGWAEPVPLVFDTFSPATNIANMYNELGPGYTGGLTMRFLHVATCEGTTIDALVTAVVQPHTEFATGTTNRTGRGFIPNYKATAVRQPKGDLGLLYDGVDANISGIALTISFFDGTGDRSGQFSTAYAIPDLQLLVYDVDGEPTQAEWVDVFYADGLASYATGAAPTSVTATPSATGVHFLGCGKDLPETDTSGAVLLRYHNTSSITLAFGAEQYRDGKNAVFSGIHGGVSLPMTGSFEEPKAVPAPGAVSPARLEEPAPPGKPDMRSASALYPGENVIRLDRVMPAKVPLNVPFDYTLKVTNLTETPVQDVVVTEHRPENFKLQGADPQPDKKNGTFSWVLGTLEAKASREIKISGVATTADTLIPCATVTFLVPISVYGNVAVVEPKLVLTATVPKEVLLCEPIPAQIVVTNPGTGDLEAVKIVETLPVGLTTMEGGSELVLEAGTLAPGQSKQFASSFKASKTGEFVCKAVASARGGLNAEATATTIVRRPVLTLTKTGPARQYLGRPITYEITVTNKGDAPAADAVVEDTVASGVQMVQPSAGGEVADTKVVWQLGTLAVGASQKVSVTYIPLEAGLLAQAATASAVGAEAVTARAETVVYGIAGVHVDVIDTNDPVPVGGRTTYVITVTNQGSSPSHNVQITATVEEPEEIVATSGATAVTVEGRTARCAPLASLAPEAKATWMVTVKARQAGDVRFRVKMTTAELGRPVEEMEATQLFE